jgi:hypothetical protein
VLPARAMAKISMRLVPDQNARDIARKFTEHVQFPRSEGSPGGGAVTARRRAVVCRPEHPIFEAAGAALEEAFGRKPVFIREGGSIPIVHSFEQTLEAPVVLIGFLLPGPTPTRPTSGSRWRTSPVARRRSRPARTCILNNQTRMKPTEGEAAFHRQACGAGRGRLPGRRTSPRGPRRRRGGRRRSADPPKPVRR